MTAYMVEYNRDGHAIKSRRITTSQAKLMLWVEELIADPNVTNVETNFASEGGAQ